MVNQNNAIVKILWRSSKIFESSFLKNGILLFLFFISTEFDIMNLSKNYENNNLYSSAKLLLFIFLNVLESRQLEG